MTEQLNTALEGLKAAIRAAELALFVIRKQGVMPNSSWESGFESDMKIARAARNAIDPSLVSSTDRAPTDGHGYSGPFSATEFNERAWDHEKAAKNGLSAGPNVSYVRTFQACALALRYAAKNMTFEPREKA